jgi:hypothetical protein
MSGYDGSIPSMDDLDLDLILQRAANDLARGLASIIDTEAGAQAITGQETTSVMSDAELDAALQAAEADLATALGRVVDTQAGAGAITAKRYDQARRRHPAVRG